MHGEKHSGEKISLPGEESVLTKSAPVATITNGRKFHDQGKLLSHLKDINLIESGFGEEGCGKEENRMMVRSGHGSSGRPNIHRLGRLSRIRRSKNYYY